MGARVVLDTNVLVSALGWRGAPHAIVRACLERRYHLLTSPAILAELERVLHYPKLQFAEPAIVDYLTALAEAAELVDPMFRLQIIAADPSDDRVLECALAGRADSIVSGDEHLAALGIFERIPILSPQAFLDREDRDREVR